MAGGRKDRRGPASRWWPCAVPCWAGRAPCRGASGAGLGGGLAADAPAGPPHPGEPVVSREGGEAGGAVLCRRRACGKDGLTLDAVCLLEAGGKVCVRAPPTRRWHVFLVLLFFLLPFFFVGELLQVVFGADSSVRLVMCSVREVSGLGGGQRAAVAGSPAEGGRGSRSDGDLGQGDPRGRWLFCQAPLFCPARWPRAGRGPRRSVGVDGGLVI